MTRRYRWRASRFAIVTAVLSLFFLTGSADANSADTEIYRWVDDDGTVTYSTTPEPEAAQRERRIYDSEGRVRDILPAPMSAEERAEAAAARAQAQRELEAAKRAREDRLRRETQLRRSYDSLQDIENLRERQERAIMANIERSEVQEKTLLRERQRIRRQMDRVDDNSSLAERYQTELEELDRRIAREREYRRGQREQLAAINERLDLDRRDFRQMVLNGSD